jgi:AraC family transcriptional regulator, regulatory protein of adaptative response / DNA-3-methyladenine glycosylase II
MPPLDRDSCTRALEARDARFDGVFFVGITSTGIYCRPICPARATLRKNRRFFSTAAAAERSGFRPCLRCRPELAPGSARVDAVPRLAESAAARIAAGALNGRSVDDLAAELGVGGRQLRRAMQQELGVSPIELAQTHRLLLAKRLLTDTRLSISTVAYASGFQSLRRFNALFSTRYRMRPDALRRRQVRQVVAEPNESVTLTLSYRPPIDWDALLAFLAARATPGVEVVVDGSYARTVRVGDRVGSVRVRRSEPRTARDHALPIIHLDVSAALVPSLMHVCAGVRQLFDLDAEPTKIESHLAASGFAPLRDLRRGLRVPGAFDGFELAIRAILGQQVSVKGATTLMARLTAEFGEVADVGDPSLTRSAVTADRLADARVSSIRAIGLTEARAATVHALARRVANGDLRLEPDVDVRAATKQLLDVPGIGPWTAEYIAMRAFHWPDAFPSGDLVLRRRAGNLTTAGLLKAADAWRPWRAYAAMQLWMNFSG